MNVQSSSSLTRRQQLAAAAAIGTVAGLFAHPFLRHPGPEGDYVDVSLCPLPALLLIASVAWLPLPISVGILLTWFRRLGTGDYYVQKAIPYAMGIYFVALAIVLLPEPKPAPASTEPQMPDQIGAVVVP
jgi:hypothetical protein